jgi:hypothetical protein
MSGLPGTNSGPPQLLLLGFRWQRHSRFNEGLMNSFLGAAPPQ